MVVRQAARCATVMMNQRAIWLNYVTPNRMIVFVPFHVMTVMVMINMYWLSTVTAVTVLFLQKMTFPFSRVILRTVLLLNQLNWTTRAPHPPTVPWIC